MTITQQCFDQIPAPLIAIDFEGVITHWSKGAVRLMGIGHHEAIGRNFADLFGQQLYAQVSSAMFSLKSSDDPAEFEGRCPSPKGPPIAVRVTTGSMRDDEGTSCGLIVYVRELVITRFRPSHSTDESVP